MRGEWSPGVASLIEGRRDDATGIEIHKGAER
ncbi:hypothetical protein BJ991_000565 [Microbacterium immunditiarum]|uniref:Uncharacterized protein n=1 Tax=Microbacterium immunditiarum TaxID=337480 RepID=A0A7Y9GLB0_9MICO|nr:hypothetical protein [Microbacterium immunditiarum]